MSPTIPYDKAMVETYREEPEYALTMIESLLDDGEPHEIDTILSQLIAAFGTPELAPGCELPAILASGASLPSPTPDGLKKTLRLMRGQVTQAFNRPGAASKTAHTPSRDLVHPYAKLG